jgi:hypothetical protein
LDQVAEGLLAAGDEAVPVAVHGYMMPRRAGDRKPCGGCAGGVPGAA